PRIAGLDDRRETRERTERRVDRFTVEPIRRGPAPSFNPVVVDQPNANQTVLARAAARDDERMRRVDNRNVVLNFHAPEESLELRAADAVRYAGAASGVAARNAISASARS